MITPITTKYQHSYSWRDFNSLTIGHMLAWQHYIDNFGAEYLSPITGKADDLILTHREQRTPVDWTKTHETLTNLFEPAQRIPDFHNSSYKLFLQSSIVILAHNQCAHAYHELMERNTRPNIIQYDDLADTTRKYSDFWSEE